MLYTPSTCLSSLVDCSLFLSMLYVRGGGYQIYTRTSTSILNNRGPDNDHILEHKDLTASDTRSNMRNSIGTVVTLLSNTETIDLTLSFIIFSHFIITFSCSPISFTHLLRVLEVFNGIYTLVFFFLALRSYDVTLNFIIFHTLIILYHFQFLLKTL